MKESVFEYLWVNYEIYKQQCHNCADEVTEVLAAKFPASKRGK
jgi:hypothetical protein